MLTRVTVEIPQDLLLKLLGYLKTRRDQCSVDRATTEALWAWLFAQSGEAPTGPAMRGYQWKMLFLPEGTCLRSWSHGEHNYARVVGDSIIHDGRSVTPNQFARSFECTVRNAWRDLYIKRPEDKKWQLASRLRAQVLAEEAETKPGHMSPASARKASKLPQADAPTQPRCSEPMPGWDLPERRKYRIRLKDFE
ncbi:hypothetical protein GJ700_19135 [Duganella sp. FT92W]|uniref:Uncharacterized protein n=1 Tax=Pseudoduganella rivuli TaxID=2666085 RepID=A0A7X2LSS1_9BURK|nr:hypothetical protein [Pseudoduganella rivuli]MRV73830.1 hypothetical protein [Pseudoduganella rivuli]